MDRLFAGLLIFVPIAGLAAFEAAPTVVVFACAALAIVPLAKYVGEATEELTRYVGTALGGLLNATFGNAPELIIALFALQHGLIDVVKASIIGSILANLLFGLGLALLIGGVKYRQQKFNETAAKSSGSTLFLTVLALIMPAIFLATSGTDNPHTVEILSIVVAILLIVAYGASLVFSLWTHQHLYAREAAGYMPRWSREKAVAVLLAAMIAVALMSELVVGSIEPLIASFGWTQVFVGVILLALVGNAAEYASAIRVAMRNNAGLALQISIGSATQIAMFVAPALVVVSSLFARPLNLVFTSFELVALILSVLVVNSVVDDGESNWFEGLLLLIGYSVIAVAFFLHP